jgi:hypothetical protein
MIFAKQRFSPIIHSIYASIGFFILGLLGCQAHQPRQLSNSQTVSALTLLAETHAPFIYAVHGNVRGPVADIVRLACKQAHLACSLTINNEPNLDAFKAVKNAKPDGWLAVQCDRSLFNKFEVIEPLFKKTEQGRLYCLTFSKKCDALITKKFIQVLRRILDHADTKNIYARYAMKPKTLFSCALPARNAPALLSENDVIQLQVQSTRTFYSPEVFTKMSCAYKQRFMPYSAGILQDHALGVLWQNWLHPRLLSWEKIPGSIRRLNQEYFGGCNNWRLPTTEELYSIYRFSPIDKSLPSFWSTDMKQPSDRIWTVNLRDGEITPADHSETMAFISVCSQGHGE